MLCPNCKAENQEDSIFCKNCGNRIEEIRKEDVLNSHSEAASELQQADYASYPHTWEWIGRINKLRQELELCSRSKSAAR